jgi:membrane fusion protein, multidrug efflux system
MKNNFKDEIIGKRVGPQPHAAHSARHDRRARAAKQSAGLLVIAALSLASLSACKRDDASAAPAETSTVAIGPENIVIVKAEEIRTGPAISGTLAPEEEATLRAELSGAVVQTYVDQGQRVNQGQELVRIDDTALRDAVLSARSGMASSQSNYENAERNLQRSETLLKAGAIADRDAEQARSAAKLAQSQLADARTRLTNAETQLAKANVRAPFSGVVSARPVNAGDVVSPGTALVTVVNPATMRLEGSVPAEDLSSVRLGLPVDFTVNGYPGRHFTGRITRVNPVADPATRQVRIIASIPNAGGTLVGGLFADGRVSSETRTAPVVPISAVDERGVRPSVVMIKTGKTQKADVTLGIRDDASETVEIRSGVQPGDTVLVGAARGISVGTAVRVSAPSDTKKVER